MIMDSYDNHSSVGEKVYSKPVLITGFPLISVWSSS